MANTSLMEYLNGIATAVQAKTGSTKKIKLKDIASEIAKIDTFGSHEFLDPITVTANGVIDVTNYSSINVSVADVDDLAAYFSEDGNGVYTVITKDHIGTYNPETDSYEMGYNTLEFNIGQYNYAYLSYNSSSGIHNECINLGSLDQYSILKRGRLNVEGVSELAVESLGSQYSQNSTRLAYYNTSGYINVTDRSITPTSIATYNGHYVNITEFNNSNNVAYYNSSGTLGTANIGKNNIIYGYRYVSSINGMTTSYNILENMTTNKVITYTSSNGCEVNTLDAGDYIIRDIDTSNLNYGTLHNYDAIFRNSSSNIYVSSMEAYDVIYYGADGRRNYLGDDYIDSSEILHRDGANLYKEDLYGSVAYYAYSNIYVSSMNYSDVVFYDQSSGHIDKKELCSSDALILDNNGNVRLKPVGMGESSGTTVSIICKIDDSDKYNPSYPVDSLSFYDSSYGSNGLGSNILYISNLSNYAFSVKSLNQSASPIIAYPDYVVSQSSTLNFANMSTSTVFYYSIEPGYWTSGSDPLGRVVNLSSEDGTIITYNERIETSILDEYDSTDWSYTSSSQKVYGKIFANGSLVNITEDMLKALVDAGFFTSAS